jgi:hypothetical protein
MENVGVFYGPLVFFGQCGIFQGHLVYLLVFWVNIFGMW